MESDNNILEMQPSVGEHRDFRDVGLTKLTPINPYEFTPEQTAWLWEKMVTQDYAFDDGLRGKPEPFIAALFDKSSMHYLIDTRGYIVLRNLNSISPDIHFAIWDRAMKFREIVECGKEIISHVFKYVPQVTRISGLIPTYNTRAVKFATLLKFKYEGELRNAIMWHNKKYGVQIFGLLREEHDRW